MFGRISQCCIRLAENDFMHIHPSEKNKILCFGKNHTFSICILMMIYSIEP